MGSSQDKYKNKPRPELRSRDLKFLSNQTGLSKIQIANIFGKFFERNESGDLNKEEFCCLYAELRPEPKEQIDEIAGYVFSSFDINKNGLISFNEFLVRFLLILFSIF